MPRREPRGALWVAIALGSRRPLQVINPHLGLVRREQQLQAAALAGEAWIGAKERGDPLILLGDFNATQRTVVHRTLADRLTDAYALRPDRRPRVATFPATMPMLRIDH